MTWTKAHEDALQRAWRTPRQTREVMGEWFGKPRPARQPSLYLQRAASEATGAGAPILHGLELQGDA